MLVPRLLREHCKLRSLGADLVAFISSTEPGDSVELARRRWELARMVHQHLAYEEQQLFSRLQSDPRTDVRAASARAKRGVEHLHSHYKTHVERWGPSEVAGRWSEFQLAAKTMVGRMMANIEREERDLFPLIADDVETGRNWHAGMRNWAGEGVAMQPLISANALR